MELQELFEQLGIALGLGLLVGLQRERVHGDIAGFRTFPLVTLTGTLAAHVGLAMGGWPLAGAYVALAALVYVGNLSKIHAGQPDPGLTTEVAVLLMFSVGAFLAVGPPAVAVAVGGATAVLLHFKRELHGLAARLGEDDFRAIMQFVTISMVILPILPDESYGPYDVWNPREIWWMVVLIVGLSLLGYVGYKLLGERAGTLLGGAFGGMVSSTATTVSFSRRSRQELVADHLAARVILVAAAVVYVRVLIEMAVVSPRLLAAAAAPLVLMTALLAALAAIGWKLHGRAPEADMAAHGNPSELRTALVFGALYAVVLLAVAWARDRFGSSGLFTVAGLSGLVDMNAITLSTAQMVRGETLSPDLGWRLVLFASLANLVFKAGVVAAWGSRGLLRLMLVLWGLALLAGLAVLAWWPGEAALLG